MCTTCGCSGNGHTLTPFRSNEKPETLSGLVIAQNTTETNKVEPEAVTPQQLSAPPPTKTIIELERDILAGNKQMAERNRGYFEGRNILALNLVSSPGSGKTALLERTLNDRAAQEQFYVVEGDQQTTRDAERIAAGGAPVVQINTGKGCHLEAEMVNKAIRQLQPAMNSTVFIENVGNLVCPSMFDLGETARVVVISVTEGEDKPIKYPDMFHTAQLCVINKIDLLPYLQFDMQTLKEYARQTNPAIEFVELSATTGEGMDSWYAWLEENTTTRTDHLTITRSMCLAIPGKITEITKDTDDPFRSGKVNFGGISREVNLSMVPEVKPGDYVLVHVGAAISVVDEEEAKITFEYLKQIGELDEL